MARAALKLGVRDVAQAAHVSPATVTRIEADRPANAATLAAVRTALEAAGVEFIAENGEGPGVKLKKGRTEMVKVGFTESEGHPSTFKYRRESLGISEKDMAAQAGVSLKDLQTLEATPPNSSKYDLKILAPVERVLLDAEKQKREIAR
ncbi:hypothetical protein STHU_43910 [Allostella humosa]|nr:hypothetical protein STHU_43910 [Stella humosa]